MPPNLASLLQLQMVERPRNLRALEDWVTAFSPDGSAPPGQLSVLSVVVRPDMSARLGVHMRPTVVTTGEPAATAGLTRSSGWEPVA